MTRTARLRLTEIPLYIWPITVEPKAPDKLAVIPQNCDCKVTHLSAVEALFSIELCDKHGQLGQARPIGAADPRGSIAIPHMTRTPEALDAKYI